VGGTTLIFIDVQSAQIADFGPQKVEILIC